MKNLRTVMTAFIIVGIFTLAARAQDAEAETTGINFTYTILNTEEPGSSGLAASGDTVRIRLFYVDVACSEYEYFFRQEGNTLTIRRLTLPPATCNKDEEALYGVEAALMGVPPGKYLIELRTMIHGRDELLWHDVINTGKKSGAGARKARK